MCCPSRYYGQSELANLLFAVERLGSQRVYVDSIHPAPELGRHVRDILAAYLPAAALGVIESGIRGIMSTSEKAVLAQLYAACSPVVPAKGFTGRYLHPIAQVHNATAQARGEDTQAKLLHITAGMRGFTDYEAV
jgi:hypothetical protein